MHSQTIQNLEAFNSVRQNIIQDLSEQIGVELSPTDLQLLHGDRVTIRSINGVFFDDGIENEERWGARSFIPSVFKLPKAGTTYQMHGYQISFDSNFYAY